MANVDSGRRERRRDARLLVIGVLIALAFQAIFAGLSYLLFSKDATTAAYQQLGAGFIFFVVAVIWFRSWINRPSLPPQ